MYLVSKEVDIFIVLAFIILFAFALFFIFKATRKKEIEPLSYWIEKIVKGDGKVEYLVRTNDMFPVGVTNPHTNINSALNNIQKAKNIKTQNQIVSRKIIHLDDIDSTKVDLSKSTVPPPPDDRCIKQGKEPEEPDHIKYSKQNSHKNEGYYQNEQGQWFHDMILRTDDKTEIYTVPVDHSYMEYLAQMKAIKTSKSEIYSVKGIGYVQPNDTATSTKS
jgi:hypothetical protein